MHSVPTVLPTDLSDFKQTYSELSNYTEFLSQISFRHKCNGSEQELETVYLECLISLTNISLKIYLVSYHSE